MTTKKLSSKLKQMKAAKFIKISTSIYRKMFGTYRLQSYREDNELSKNEPLHLGPKHLQLSTIPSSLDEISEKQLKALRLRK